MNRFTLARGHPTAVRRPARARLVLERLEERTALSNYTAANVADLIADIRTANAAGGTNTITLVANTTFTLTAADNTTDGGGNGLPVIAANDTLTIQGNGDTIARSTASGTPAFRLFDVAAGASLTLNNMTLANGQVVAGTGMDAFGGGVYSSGSLTLTSVTLSSDSARGGDGQWDWDPDYGVVYSSPGGSAYGGGLYVAGGTVMLSNVTLSSNSAQGGAGYFLNGPTGGGSGYGGGLYVASGAATLGNVTLSSNSAIGGDGWGPTGWAVGGFAYGGGLYVAGGTLALTSDTLSSNSAQGGVAHIYTGPIGNSNTGGLAYGGGLYVAGGTVTLSSSTLSSNSAQGGAGWYGGAAQGGGVYVAGGMVTLTSDSILSDSAVGGASSLGTKRSKGSGSASGGGLFIFPAATVYLDAFTLTHTKTNKPDQIYGTYTLIT